MYAKVFERGCPKHVLTCYDNLISGLETPIGEADGLRLGRVDCEFPFLEVI